MQQLIKTGSMPFTYGFLITWAPLRSLCKLTTVSNREGKQI